MPALVAWNYHIEVIFYCFSTYAAPFFNVVCILFALTLLNRLLVRYVPRFSLTAAELVIIYVMLSLQGALCSHNMMQILIGTICYPAAYARPENGWQELFVERLPEWLFIRRESVYHDFYLGNSTYWTWEHLSGWLMPALSWSIFCTALLLTMYCLARLLRRRWIHQERLSYPVVQLPLALASQPRALLGSRMFWAGATVAALLSLSAGLHELYPAVPAAPIGRYSMDKMFTEPPWTVLRGMRWGIYPWALGIFFLMPLDLAFSAFLFYVLFCAERVLGAYTGWSSAGGYPWSTDRAFGAYIGLLFMGLWVGRQHFAGVVTDALAFWRRVGPGQERGERLALWGAIAGIAYLTWFATQVGITVWVALAFFLLYFALAIMMTRIRAEMGFPTHDLHYMAPPQTFTRLLPPQTYGVPNLVGFASFWWFNRVLASHPMPHMLEGYKMTTETNGSMVALRRGVIIAAIVAPLLVFLIVPHYYYQYGAASGRVNTWGTQFGREGFTMLEGWLRRVDRLDRGHWWATLVGFGIVLVLGAARVRLIGWPLHPLSYALSNSWGVEQLWLCLLIAAMIKGALLRWGGLRAYRQWIPFFLGLTLGDFLMGGFWNLSGLAFDFRPYDFWPGIIK
ncbi:MAG TPA: hypothetical protein DCZ72_06990 [Armatimonadetes bacterium]|nr:hypothetical protein [Armatimonadota bacterium]